MIIVLPSGHEGGMLELSHNGKVVHFGSSQLLQGAFGAWFSDVTHEIKEITAGYRLVLTYNLVNETPGAHFSAGSLGQQLVALGQALASWSALLTAENQIQSAIYMLEHRYTDASLRIDTLKGPDLAKAKAVQHFAAQNGLVLYLASMEKYILYDGDEEDELDSSLKLDRLVDVGGRKFAGGISIDEEEIISCDPYDGRDPTEQTHEDYTGNAGATSTHWYRDTVLVIRKREHNVHLLLKSGEAGYSYSGKKPDVGSLLGKHLEVARRNPGDNAARLDVLAICQYVIDKNVNGRYDWNRIPDEIVSKVVEALATVQADRKQLHQAVKALSAKGTLASQAFGALGATVQGPDADKTLAFV
ncbi:2OG-Fe(II) oxygenase superfamily [Teratosphaeria destructans]|uniref:2OG-Fe(II) oxygenase superfamily n=1 Tax=Teratosphaeria destructans TaxID=418781 RepID=A0A9W7SIL1_9PEZI|nr:2OG-Fe(II) oxygenase superfamily [Teratosphaeria destructans]